MSRTQPTAGPTRDLPSGLSGSGGSGSISSGWTRLDLADVVASGDPGSRLAATITDRGNGSGIRIQITGGWTSTDWAGDYPYLVWNINDLSGGLIGNSDIFSVPVLLKIRTHPGDSSDTELRIALLNESDLTSTTIDGHSAGIRWNTAARFALTAPITNGANAAASLSPSGATTAEYLQTYFQTQGYGSGITSVAPRTCLLDSTGAYISNSNINAIPSQGIVLGNPTKFYLAITAGRTATTAGTVTIDVDAYYSPPVGRSLPL